MKENNYAKAWKKFEEILSELSVYDYAMNVMDWDAYAGNAPSSGADMRSEAVGHMAQLYYKRIISKKSEAVIYEIEQQCELLDETQRAAFCHFKKSYDKTKAIPEKEYKEYTKLCSKAENVWAEARNLSDFKMFEPYLEQLVAFNRRFIEYRGGGAHPYDTLVDDFEPGMDVEQLDVFFDGIKEKIVPLYKEMDRNDQQRGILTKKTSLDSQREYSKMLVELLGFDLGKGVLGESAHPFSMGLSKDDVRLTSAYHKNDFMTSILSTAHETGHSIFEQNIDGGLLAAYVAKHIPYALHESQSRFYENHIARSMAFFENQWSTIAGTINHKLMKVTPKEAYKYANAIRPTTIRIDSDELAYPLHIIIRYEMEKLIFSGGVRVCDLPEMWNEKTKEYLGLVPENDAMGILQDIHWSGGSFGYFPSYALGSAYAAQFFNAMDREIGVEDCVSRGDYATVTKWLNRKVHRFGGMKSSEQALLEATGERFDVGHYTNYLINKFAKK